MRKTYPSTIKKAAAYLGPVFALVMLATCESPLLEEIRTASAESRAEDGLGTPGVLVSPTTGLYTSENGTTAEFSVVLRSSPASVVTVPVQSLDTTEGVTDTEALDFSPSNWSVEQTVTVTGVDDDEIDGDQPYVIQAGPTQSEDPDYDGLNAPNVTIINRDNDSASVIVSPISGLVTTEYGDNDSCSVVLGTRPSHPVTIPLSSSDESEGTVSPDQLVFTSENWDVPQDVIVTGVDDSIVDGDQVFYVIVGKVISNDHNYDGYNPDNVEVTNIDNDTPGIFVHPTSGLETTEAGGTAEFTVTLLTQPMHNVIIPIASSDTSEGTVSPTSITFTPADWTPRTVMITGVNDNVADGDQPYTIIVGAANSDDENYDNTGPFIVSAINRDNDTTGFILSKTSGLSVDETGTTDTFTVRLRSQPTANVTISVSSSNTGYATVTPSGLTFTPLNWDTSRTITARGVDHMGTTPRGAVSFHVSFGGATSSDGNYSGTRPQNVSGTNTGEPRQAAAPSVTPASGVYYAHQTAIMSPGVTGQTVRFEMAMGTTTPPDPTSSSTAASAAISVTSARTTIKARGFYQDWAPSNIVTRVIEIPYVRSTVSTGLNVGSSPNPRGLAWNHDGTSLYVGDLQNNRVRRFGTDGALHSTSDISLGAQFLDMDWISSGYVVISTSNAVRVYNPSSGSVELTYTGLTNPAGVVWTGDELLVSDSRTTHPEPFIAIRTYEASGQHIGDFETIQTYGELAMHRKGVLASRVYGADGFPGVDVYNLQGEHVGLWTVPSGNVNHIAAHYTTLFFGFEPHYIYLLYAVANTWGAGDVVYRFSSSGDRVTEFVLPPSDHVRGIAVTGNDSTFSPIRIYLLMSDRRLVLYQRNQ